jgi:hypothetical protein
MKGRVELETPGDRQRQRSTTEQGGIGELANKRSGLPERGKELVRRGEKERKVSQQERGSKAVIYHFDSVSVSPSARKQVGPIQ